MPAKARLYLFIRWVSVNGTNPLSFTLFCQPIEAVNKKLQCRNERGLAVTGFWSLSLIRFVLPRGKF